MESFISAVIITKNEEENIERCILSLQGLVEEILVIDSGSTDGTIILSEKTGARVIQTNWLGYAATKNFGNRSAKHDFILSMDADEQIDPDLKLAILAQKEQGLTEAYSFNRLTNYCGKWIKRSGWYPDVKTRLFHKERALWVGDFVHETLQLSAGEEITHLPGDLLHYSYKTKQEHIERTTKYALLAAQKLKTENKSASWLKPFLSCTAKFLTMYVFKLGFLEGKTGFQLALISSKGVWLKYKELRKIS